MSLSAGLFNVLPPNFRWFNFGLCNDVVFDSRVYIVLDDRIIWMNNFGWVWRRTCIKSIDAVGQDCWSPSRHSEPALTEYKTRVLTAESRRSEPRVLRLSWNTLSIYCASSDRVPGRLYVGSLYQQDAICNIGWDPGKIWRRACQECGRKPPPFKTFPHQNFVCPFLVTLAGICS